MSVLDTSFSGLLGANTLYVMKIPQLFLSPSVRKLSYKLFLFYV